MCVCVCVCVCVCARAARARACVHACVCVRACVYDTKITTSKAITALHFARWLHFSSTAPTHSAPRPFQLRERKKSFCWGFNTYVQKSQCSCYKMAKAKKASSFPFTPVIPSAPCRLLVPVAIKRNRAVTLLLLLISL